MSRCAAEEAGDADPDWRADAGTGVGSGNGVVETVAALGDVVECRLVLPQRRRDEPQFGSERGEEAGIERRYRAGASNNNGAAVHVDFVAGVGVGVGADV